MTTARTHMINDQQWPVVRPLLLSITDRFALELIGLILYFLRYDMKTLHYCVSVCRVSLLWGAAVFPCGCQKP